MKQTFNSLLNTLPKIDEVNLFRLMADLFNSDSSKATFVKEVHGHKGFVDYHSNILGSLKQIEIADLLLITCNRRNNEIRICFIQAKHRKGNYRRFLTFKANVFQWELLAEKPDVIDNYGAGFPTNILNFSTFESITSFGIFYHDRNGLIDFLYTLPKHILPRSKKKIQTMDFWGNCICPNSSCLRGKMPNETISTCSMNIFKQEALACRIGAPIDSSMRLYLSNLFSSMRKNSSENIELIDEFMGRLDVVNNDISDDMYQPNTILLMTDGEEYNKNFG